MPIKVALASVPIFQFVQPEQLKNLADIAKIVEKNKGDLILMQGEAVAGVYLIGEGAVGVHAAKPERLLVTLKPGESFGEMSFLEKTKASATIRAEERATKLLVFLHADLTALVDRDPNLGRAFFKGLALQLSLKLRRTTDHLAEESAAGQQLLSELGGAGEGGLADLGAEIDAHRTNLAATLDAALAGLGELAKKLPEKAGSFASIAQRLTGAKQMTNAFMPRLQRHVAGMATLTTRIEELIAGMTNG